MTTNKMITILFCLIALFIFINGTTLSLSPCDSPFVGGHTGAPGESGCNGCHAGTVNSGNAIIDFDLGTSTYVQGQTYQGFVRIQQSGFDKFGFSGLALKNSDHSTVGTFGLTDSVRTRIYADGNRNYVSHTPCGADSADANSWYFKWTAPITNEDSITLYIGALVANHNHATSGDFSYTRKIVLPVQTTSHIGEANSLPLRIYPNPVTTELAFEIPVTITSYDYSITDLTGKIIQAENNYSAKSVNISRLPSGIYHVGINAGEKYYSSKFQKQ